MKLLVTLGLLASLLSVTDAAFDGTSVDIKQTGYLKFTDCLAPTHNEQAMIVPINTCIHDTTTQLGGKAVKYTDVAVITGTDDGGGGHADANTIQYKIVSYYNSDCSDASPMSVSAVMYATRNLPAATTGFPDCGTIDIDTSRAMDRSKGYYDSSHADYVGTYAKGTYEDGLNHVASTYTGIAHYGAYLPSNTISATPDSATNGGDFDSSGADHTLTLTAGYTGTLAIGMSVTGTGIAAGTVVKDVSSDTITLSADSSGTASGT